MPKYEELSKVKQHLEQYRIIADIQRQNTELNQQYNTVSDRRAALPPIRNEADDYSVSKGAVAILSIVFIQLNLALSVLLFRTIGSAHGAVILSVLGAVIGIFEAYFLLKLRVRRKQKKAQALYDARMENARKINEKTDEICETIARQQAELMQKRKAIAQQLKNDPDSVVPEAYWHVADDICSLMENGRADSVKEAINLLEDIWHKNRLENAAQNAYVYMPEDNSAELDLMRQQVEATKRHTQAVQDLDLHMFLRSIK